MYGKKKLLRGRFCIYELKRIIQENVESLDDGIAIKAFIFQRKKLPSLLCWIEQYRRDR